ncbi:MAG: hypothetical protein LBS68_03820 [Puniceicoccales bacterium]|jgi:hypothetical protein|nr:hypothetical protein [Puniceicoccales bacterium]
MDALRQIIDTEVGNYFSNWDRMVGLFLDPNVKITSESFLRTVKEHPIAAALSLCGAMKDMKRLRRILKTVLDGDRSLEGFLGAVDWDCREIPLNIVCSLGMVRFLSELARSSRR